MTEKAASLLRKNLLAQRIALNDDLFQKVVFEKQLNESILRFLEELETTISQTIHTIAFFWPIQGEPDIRPALKEWQRGGDFRILALPITQKNEALKFAEWSENCEMSRGLFDIPEPKSTTIVNPSLIIAPCLGWLEFEGRLWRLGYGGGYYDRTMESLHKRSVYPAFVGVASLAQKLERTAWKPQRHDISMDAVITETSWQYATKKHIES